MKRKISEPELPHQDQNARKGVPDAALDEDIDLDDLCPICHLLLYRPVRTRCNHTLCESCMAHWADVSITSQMATVGLDDEAVVLLPNEIETRCPMCRTLTTASLDPDRQSALEGLYPVSYSARETESKLEEEDDFGSSIETLTVYIGNEHSLVRTEGESNNRHHWKFFVRPSRTDLIEEVQIFLHPTFRNPRVIVQYPPYEIRRLGWGYFTIFANVILKAGYSWLSPDAEDAPDGGRNGKLPLEWTLDFNGRGSQGRLRLKVRKEKEGQEAEDEAQRDEVRRLWARQREIDPDWEDADARL
ncbi:hypothetical protein HRR83_005498 [Exophiala dermatitidis]|uniref:Protein AF-9 homolog n=1 Tax=Exophiala dermatitidis TaxID=5970 RepID=A0AAN6ET83_EXODE|nr:hypothetical protein HRR75_004906 [Exophiala dermatitidis]KAJ4516194.1 hypothetical protein HRR74_005351 [Exophiala dermatitidis]KAJ4518400.1 hypothetical protein HRR73_003981 [Exophiala dermatitidis]KAJ4533894.1 hypothetical protein HRR76_005845 [Exophiala dermatitidis]KAJ4550050.1 hypothetical protein HRR77_003531 [Exophiala dermatitidis]